NGFSSQPACSKTQNDEVALDFTLTVAGDHLTVAGKSEGLDQEGGLFTDFADDCVDKRFAGFNHTARQHVEIERGLARAAHHQHFSVAKNGSADCQEWTLRVGSLVGHAGLSFHQPVEDVLRLMIAPARAINGFSQPICLQAPQLSASSIAARVASSTIVIVTASVSRVFRTFESAWS